MRLDNLTKVYFLFLFSISQLNLSGCVYLANNKRPDGTVVERNKESRPAWVDSPTDQLLHTSTETRFHFAILKARDLPIAVKKSQIAAIEASYPLWLQIFEQAFRQVKEVKTLTSSSKLARDFAEFKNNFAHRVHAEVAQVEDIYFERVKIENQKAPPDLDGVGEYFDVHTLVHLNAIDQERFTKELAEQMLGSRNKQIRQAGKDLMKRISSKPPSNAKSSRTKVKK